MFVNSLFISFLRIVVSCWWQRTYGRRGCPRRPNPLRGKDLGQQHNTTLACQVQIELFLGNPLDVARLSDMKGFTPFYDFGPLMPVRVLGVKDNANDTSRFGLNCFHDCNSLKVVGCKKFVDSLRDLAVSIRFSRTRSPVRTDWAGCFGIRC